MSDNSMGKKSFLGIDFEAILKGRLSFPPLHPRLPAGVKVLMALMVPAALFNVLAGAGGETIVKLRIAEAMQGKRIMPLPTSEGGMNLKTTDMNRLIE